jgi:hypothetical protein
MLGGFRQDGWVLVGRCVGIVEAIRVQTEFTCSVVATV